MMVTVAGEHVGHIDDSAVPYRGGSAIVIDTPIFDDSISANSDINDDFTMYRLVIPVRVVSRSVSICDMDIVEVADVFELAGRRDRIFHDLVSAGARVSSYRDVVRNGIVVSAHNCVAEPDIDTYERLFDLDVFTPA